jgi:CheY-like chemotaxis protein
MPDGALPNINTRFLQQSKDNQPVPDAERETSLAQEVALPYVIELRVVGTPSIMQKQVKDQMLIGRGDADRSIAPEIDLTTYDGLSHGVSRQHAVLLVRDERLFLRDLGSTNGTRLNGLTCEPKKEYRVRHGDEIALGRLRLQVLFAVTPLVEGGTPVYGTLRPPDIPRTGKGEHILVVEDDKEVGSVFRMALELAGYKATLVDTVTKALTSVFQMVPDAIVLDLMLPDMNGLDLLQYLKKQTLPRRIPIVVVSGATGGFQMNQAMEAGAERFLGKPVAVEKLVQTVSDVLRTTMP